MRQVVSATLVLRVAGVQSEKVMRGRDRRQAHLSSLAAERIGMPVGYRNLAGTRDEGENLISSDSGVNEQLT